MSTLDFTFSNQHRVVARPYNIDGDIECEPMLFSASASFARAEGGPITQQVLNALCEQHLVLPSDGLRLNGKRLWSVIDTRVHYLQKGQLPAIPGWHCDGQPRERRDSQPSLANDRNHRHFIFTLVEREGVSLVEYVAEPMRIQCDPAKVWSSVDSALRRCKKLKTCKQPSGEIWSFTSESIHRATPSEVSGWRYFFRMSWYHTPPQPKLRKQSQVYTTTGGW